MYNLKIEALKIINQLIDNGYDAYFIGNYPFVKCHNSFHQNDKIKVKQISMITNATLENIRKSFKVSKVNEDDYSKSAMIEVLVKQNLVYFKIYYATGYTNVINNSIKKIDTVEKIQAELSFLLETMMMDKDSKLINYVGKKTSAFESVELKLLQSNGNFREKVLDNPLIMLELCYHASNMDYFINDATLKIVLNNNHYLKFESLENIVKYFNMILMSKNPVAGIKIIKDQMINFKYGDVEIFKFLASIPNEYIEKLNKFNNSIDIISRWTYLLRSFSEEESITIIDNFKLGFKNKIIWMLQNFDLIKQENYKMAIYNSRESLKQITEAKWNVFLLFDMFDRLTRMHKALDNTLEEKCKLIIETIYSRPFFEYQLLYDNKELCEIANIEEGPWLNFTKENLLNKIIMCKKHPTEEVYLEMTKESIEFGLISAL